MTRLITRSDFDGLFCAVLLKQVEKIDEVIFAHPKDVQDGKVEVQKGDILTNLPYHPNCGVWFDHHSSEESRVSKDVNVKGALEIAPSAARIVYKYYGGEKTFPKFAEIIEVVDRIDSAQLSLEEIRNPQGWILLGYIMDPRTGLGRYHHFRISNYNLMMKFINLIQDQSLEEILSDEDVKERLDLYYKDQEAFIGHIQETSITEKNVVISDVRGHEAIPIGNRFMTYAVYPDINVSIRISDGFKKQNTVLAVAHSITNRTCQTDIGELMSQYGGGGHKGAGTCQIAHEDVDAKLKEITQVLVQNG